MWTVLETDIFLFLHYGFYKWLYICNEECENSSVFSPKCFIFIHLSPNTITDPHGHSWELIPKWFSDQDLSSSKQTAFPFQDFPSAVLFCERRVPACCWAVQECLLVLRKRSNAAQKVRHHVQPIARRCSGDSRPPQDDLLGFDGAHRHGRRRQRQGDASSRRQGGRFQWAIVQTGGPGFVCPVFSDRWAEFPRYV